MIALQKEGVPVGLFSVCSANPVVIETALKFAAKQHLSLIVESTCNQVNQFGGYTGLRPQQFADFVWGLVAQVGLPKENLILGGDHLGPFPWMDEPAETAFQKANQMVRDYVAAGYQKIHLDASMHCADDDPNRPLAVAVAAQRAAEMCAVAEETAQQLGLDQKINYVIGTEVPTPGGADSEEHLIEVTRLADVRETIRATKAAFESLGLAQAWERVIAVVVQPGVEFGDNSILAYQPEKSGELSQYIKADAQLVFEAHSTDYQTEQALEQLVRDQFAILKVGPELTFAYREAVFLLEMVEAELFAGHDDTSLSDLRRVVDAVMKAQPQYWEKYYPGDEHDRAFARKYSYSDRIRYYWPEPAVQAAIQRLLDNLGKVQIPDALVRQFFPCQYEEFKQMGEGLTSPMWFVEKKVRAVLEKYTNACAALIVPVGDDSQESLSEL